MRRRTLLLGGVVLVLGALAPPLTAVASTPSDTTAARAQLGGVRIPFIANQGQLDARVAYYASTFVGTVFVTPQGELVYALTGPRTDAKRDGSRLAFGPGWSLTETLVGGRARRWRRSAARRE